MIHMNNFFRLLCLSLSLVIVAATAAPTYTPVVESILHNGFPTQPDVLAKTTQSLSDEFKKTGNIASLVFYAYGMLRQANYFLTTNDIIRASEYAKTGFFYLDEAVDLNQNIPLIRYLRAKVDAYLPAELGRCVITLEDTDILLKQELSSRIRDNVNDMRYSYANYYTPYEGQINVSEYDLRKWFCTYNCFIYHLLCRFPLP